MLTLKDLARFADLGCEAFAYRVSNDRGLSGPNAIDSVVMPTRDEVQMEVEHRLLSRRSRRADQVHALRFDGNLYRAPDPYHRLHKVTAQHPINRPHIGQVATWNDESVTRSGRIIREERHPVLALGDDLDGRVIATRDCAEGTVTDVVDQSKAQEELPMTKLSGRAHRYRTVRNLCPTCLFLEVTTWLDGSFSASTMSVTSSARA